jgi:hypothetical protein
MLPRSEMMQRYRQFATDPLAILKAGAQRQLYDDWQQANQQSETKGTDHANEDSEELEWENFVVVEKIDIYDEVELQETIDRNEER